jgi:hypothetical protein
LAITGCRKVIGKSSSGQCKSKNREGLAAEWEKAGVNGLPLKTQVMEFRAQWLKCVLGSFIVFRVIFQAPAAPVSLEEGPAPTGPLAVHANK